MSEEQRKHPRFPCSNEATIILNDVQRECFAVNISASGAAFKSDWRPNAGTILEIRFKGSKPVKGQVVRHTREGFAVTSVWDLQPLNDQ